MQLSQPSQHSQFHNLFASLHSFNTFLFLLGILTYIVSPIVGCVFILLFLQIKISSGLLKGKLTNRSNILFRKTELFLILLVLFAITIYGSTFSVFDDLEAHIGMYNELEGTGFKGLFYLYDGKIEGREVEPVTFVIPQILGMIFGYHDGHFILIQSFTFNLIFTIFSCMLFPFLYPLVILINITSGVVFYGTSVYFYHMFLMRQFYSYIFILFMTFTPSLTINLIFLTLSFFAHKSSAIFSFPLFLASIPYFPKDLSLFPIKSKFFKLLQFISKFLFDRKIIIFLLVFTISISLFSTLVQLYVDNLDLENTYDAYVYSDASSHRTFSIIQPSWIATNILPEIFLFVFSTIYFRNFLSFHLSPRKYAAQTSFFIICAIVISLLIFGYLTDLDKIFFRAIACLVATKGFLYGFIIESLTFSRKNDRVLSRFVTVLAVVFMSYSLGTWFYRNFLSSYYFFFRSSNVYLRAYVTQLNDLPTIVNNLFDYFYYFFRLAFS